MCLQILDQHNSDTPIRNAQPVLVLISGRNEYAIPGFERNRLCAELKLALSFENVADVALAAPIRLLKAAGEFDQPKLPSVLLKGLEPHPRHRRKPGKVIPVNAVTWCHVHWEFGVATELLPPNSPVQARRGNCVQSSAEN